MTCSSNYPPTRPVRPRGLFSSVNLAEARGDYDEAARQYQRALNIRERLGDQAKIAISYSQLGVLAQLRGDYDEAARQYQRALDIYERLGDQARMAATYY